MTRQEDRFQRRLRRLLVALLAAAGMLAGCGYHLKSGGDTAGLRIDSIAIPLIPGPSSETGFEADFTRIIREEFIRHARIPLAAPEEARMVLNARVVTVTTEPLTFDQQQQTIAGHTASFRTTSRRRLSLKMEASLLDKQQGQIVWEEQSLEAKADFEVTGDPLATRYHQQNALLEIARRLARRIFQLTAERF